MTAIIPAAPSGHAGSDHPTASNFKQLLEACDGLDALKPGDADAYRERGELYRALGDAGVACGLSEQAMEAYQRAIGDFDAALGLMPDNPRVHLDRGRAYAARGQQEKGLEDVTRALTLDPQLADAFTTRGLIYEASQQYRQALQDFEQAVQLAPQSAEAYGNRADANLALGNAEAAEADYTRAIELDAGLVAAHLGRSQARVAQQQFEPALEDCTTAIALDPANVSAHGLCADLLLFLGDRCQSSGEGERARDYYRRALAEGNKLVRLASDLPQAHLARGQAHARLDHGEKALADFNRAVQDAPDLAIGHTLRGLWYEQHGEYERALQDYEDAVRLEPQNAVAHRNRADAHLALGHLDLAEADYSQAIEIEPTFIEAYLGRAQARKDLEDFDQAREDYGAVLGFDSQNASALAQRGELNLLQAQFCASHGQNDLAQHYCHQAIADFDLALSWQPNDPGGYLGRAQAHGFLAEYPDAIADCSQAIQLAPKLPEPYLARAQANALAGAYNEAMRDCAAVLHLDSSNVTAHGLRGDLYLQRGDLASSKGQMARAQGFFRKAVADYTAILESAPDSALAYMSRGRAQARLDNVDGALADFSKALELQPEWGDAYTERGLLYERSTNYKNALEDYEQAVRLAPGPAAYRNRADAHLALRHYEQAIADYSEAIKSQPGFLEAYLGRAQANVALEKYDEALQDVQTVLQGDPENGFGHDQLGDIYTHLGNQAGSKGEADRAQQMYEQALDAYGRAVSALPDAPWARLDRARAHARLEQYDRAVEDYSYALKLDPKLADAHSERGALYLWRAQYREALYREALLDFDALVTLEPQRAEGYTGRADAMAALGSFQRAVWDYDAGQKLAEDDPAIYSGRYSARMALAEEFRARGLGVKVQETYEAALSDCDALARLRPGEPLVYKQRGLALRALESYDLAVAAFDQALSLTPESDRASGLYTKGETLHQWALAMDADAQDKPATLENAIQAFDAALVIVPDMADLHSAKGSAYGELKRYDEAIRAFARALECDPKYAFAYIGQGAAYYLQGDYKQARGCNDQALKLARGGDSNRAWACIGRGLALEAQGSHDEAEKAYAQALRSMDRRPTTATYLARAHIFESFEDARALHRAEEDYRTGLEHASEAAASAESRNELAWFYVDKMATPEKLEQALELADQAVQSEKDAFTQALYLDTLGWGRYRTGHYADATHDLRRATQQAPHDAIIRYHLRRAEEMLAQAAHD